MPVERLRQPSFAGGEFAPGMWGRSDYSRYPAGAKTLLNFVVTPHGAAATRPGTIFDDNTRTDLAALLVPFVYSDEDVVVLEFTNLRLRFYDPVAGTWAALVITTTYTEAELDRLRFAQVGDVVTLVHPDHAPAELTRTSATTWTLADIDTTPRIAAVTTLRFKGGTVLQTAPDSAHPSKEWAWMVSSVNSDGEESLPSFVLRPPATSSTSTSRKAVLYSDYPVDLEWQPVDGAVAYNVYRGRSGVFGWVGQAREEFSSSGTLYVTFRDDGDRPDYAQRPPSGAAVFTTRAWAALTYVREGERRTNGGRVYECIRAGTTAATGGPTGTGASITDGATTAWATGTVYATGAFVVNEGETFEATSGGTSGVGLGPFQVYFATTIDNTVTWTWRGHGGAARWKYVADAPPPAKYPSAVAFHEGRRIFANTEDAADLVLASRVDRYHDFEEYLSEPPDGAFSFSVASRRYEEVRALVSRNSLLALTSGSEWTIQGAGQGEVLAPGQIAAHPGSEHGSSWTPPLSIGTDVLFVQRKGATPRALLYSSEAGGYASSDLSVVSRHLFDGRTIVRWAYAEDPWSVVWAVTSDGQLLSLTWSREQEMAAWTPHEIGGDGFVEDVCTVPLGDEDAVFLVVKRTVNGATVRFIERLASRRVTDVVDAVCLDASITYSGAATNTITGLSHLEGCEVYALADGFVTGPYTVASGEIELSADDFPDGASKVTVGLRYDCDFVPLDPPRGKHVMKVVRRVWLEMEASSGVLVGPDEDHLKEWEHRTVAMDDDPAPLETTEAEILVSGAWGQHGEILVRQADPLPLTILAMTREVEYGDGR